MKKDKLKWSLRFMGVVAGVMGLALAALPQDAAAQKKFEGVEITIATFAGSWELRFREEVGPAMEKMGIKMKFIGGRTDQFLAKLIAAKGKTPFDVVEITDHVFSDMMQGEFLETLNLDNIPNKQYLNPALYDDHRVGYWVTQAAVLWNWKKFEELGIPHPTGMEDLLHSKLKGKIMFPKLTSYNAIPYVLALAKKYGGDEGNIDPALPVLRKFTKQVHSFAEYAAMTQGLKNEDVYAVLMAGHVGLQMLGADVPMAVRHIVIDGREGVPSIGYLGMVKGTKHPEAVEAFLNEAIGWEMQEGVHVESGLPPTNNQLLAKYAFQQKKDPFGTYYNLMEPKMVDQMYYIKFGEIDRRAWGKKLQRVQAGE